MPLKTYDFSTVNIGYVDPGAVSAMIAGEPTLFIVGFDGTPQSADVRSTILSQGALFDPYRFLYAQYEPTAQVDSVVRAVINVGEPWPSYIWLDIEENRQGQAPTIAQIEAAMDRMDQLEIRAQGTIVKPGVYTGKWVWDKYYDGYTGPADRGYALWALGPPDPNGVRLFGGWPRAEGSQYQWDVSSPIGLVDYSGFRDRTATPVPVPDGGGGGGPDIPDLQDRLHTQAVTLASLRDELGQISATVSVMQGQIESEIENNVRALEDSNG
jgi:hypothetical protein